MTNNTTENIATPAKESEVWIENESDMPDAAAAYAEFEKNLTMMQTIKIFPRAILWIFYAQIVVFGYGIDGVIASSLISIPRFREDYGEKLQTNIADVTHIIPAKWQSAWAGVSQLTAILGAAGVGYLSDKIGRKYTNAILCLISIGGVCGQYFSYGNIGVMTAGKAINGFSIGGWLVIAPLYASEVAPLKLRGWLIALTNIVNFMGLLIFFGVMYELAPLPSVRSYRISIALQWLVPAVVLLTIWVFPESPVWLARQGKREEAMISIRKTYGTRTGIDHNGLYAQIEATIERERNGSGEENNSYLECFDRKNRKRTLITMFTFASLQFGGNIFVLGYQSYYYQLMGFGTEKSFLLNILCFAFMFISTILSWPLMMFAGRRPIIIYGTTIAGICMIIVGGASTAGTFKGYVAVISFMFAWSVAYQMTLGSVGFPASVEIPSHRLRARTTSLANMAISLVQWVIGFTFPYMFNPDAGNLGGKVGFIFGAMTLLVALGHFFWLPETKNRTPHEMDLLFERKTSLRHFNKVDLTHRHQDDRPA